MPWVAIKDTIMYIAVVCNNIGNLSKVCLMVKYCNISSAYNIQCYPWILLKFCTEHASVTVVLCAIIQKDSWIKKEAMEVIERFLY